MSAPTSAFHSFFVKKPNGSAYTVFSCKKADSSGYQIFSTLHSLPVFLTSPEGEVFVDSNGIVLTRGWERIIPLNS